MTTFFLDYEAGDDLWSDQSLYDRGRLTVNNGLTAGTGRSGIAANVNAGGSASCLFSGSSPGGMNFSLLPWSIETWAQFSSHSASAVETMFSQWSTASGNLGWRLGMNASGQLELAYSTTGSDTVSVAGAYTPVNGSWAHFCAECDGTNIFLYADGVQIATAARSAALFASTLNIVVGNVNNGGSKFPGLIDSVRVTIGATRYGAAFTPPAGAFPLGYFNDRQWRLVPFAATFSGDGTGTSFANRWKTIEAGASSARIAAGDTIKVMGSPVETSLGQAATWTQGNQTVTLTTAVTQLLDDGESAWTASTNVTATASTNRKSGADSASLVEAAGFTTGLAAYKATASALDLSGFQQVTLWMQSNVATGPGQLSLRLCSDTAGAVTVNKILLPPIRQTGKWVPVTVDTGAALGSSIQSVALYVEQDFGGFTVLLDNINAAKASSSADALTLMSMIGKVHNVPWAATTAYVLNDQRRPTPPNRNGFRYKVTTAGTTGSTEPVWPEYVGGTVVDGTVTWTCEGLEDTWYPIQSFNGTAIRLDAGQNASAGSNINTRGYSGTTETVTTYKREPIRYNTSNSQTAAVFAPQVSGTGAAPVTYSGGWDRSSMANQSLESWFHGGTGNGRGWGGGNFSGHVFNNFGMTRFFNGIAPNSTNGFVVLQNFHSSGNDDNGFLAATSNAARYYIKGYAGVCSGGPNVREFYMQGQSRYDVRRARLEGSATSGAYSSVTAGGYYRFEDCYLRNNGNYGLDATATGDFVLFGCLLANNGTADVNDPNQDVKMHNCKLDSTNQVAGSTSASDLLTQIGKVGQVADTHKLVLNGATVVSDAVQRHSASGIAWRFNLTSTTRHQYAPVVLPVAQVPITTPGLTKTIGIWVRRDSGNIQGKLRVRGGQLNGVPETSVACTPAQNVWEQSTITVTPSERGILEVEFLCWDGVGTAASLWVDDVSIT
jgi:hypothetical protein